MSKVIQEVDEPIQALTLPWVSNTYIAAATSDNTRRAYQSDIRHFENWGGRLPATVEMISRYLHVHAEQLNSRTLARRVTALKNWHVYQQFPDPTQHPLIQKMLTGIARTHGVPKDKAPAMTIPELQQITHYLCGQANALAKRDLALIHTGFFGALRRSELVNIEFEHIRWEDEGVEILLPSSKTDQLHEGQHSVMPIGQGLLCPVTHLKNWLLHANIKSGPIFPRIFSDGRLADKAIAALNVNLILKQRALEAGIAEGEKFSSHSLRRGLATCAARSGASLQSIMRQGRWKQVNTVLEYIEAAERFTENAASSIFKELKIDENEVNF